MILLTGHEGFIGKAFLKTLGEKNVYGVDKNQRWWLRKYFTDWDKVDLILHQGAISATTEKNLSKLHSMNVDDSVWILTEAMKRKIPIKYASSASVYGNMSDGTINPLNYYALSKVTVDYWILDNIDKFDSLVQGFRYFNVYGQGEESKGDQASPISKFSKQIQETGKLKLFEGSDKFFRDFIFIDDVVDIVLNNNKGSGIYDLGTSNPVSFEEVAKCVAKRYNGEIEYIPFPNHLRGKYQGYTCAKSEWNEYKFVTVENYLNEIRN